MYYNYENNPFKADKYASMLIKDFPDNPVFERWKGRIEAKEANYAKASDIFRDILNKAYKNFPGYNNPNVKREAAYYIAYQFRNVSQIDSAKYYFKICAQNSWKVDKDEASGFLINSYLYLGMIEDLEGKRENAKKYYKELLDMKEYGTSHELANKYLKNPYNGRN